MLLLDFFVAPLMVPFMLWSALSFWWLLVTFALFALTQGLVYSDNRPRRNGDGDFVAALIVLFILFAVVSYATTSTDGFWATVWEVLKKSVLYLLQYCVYGLMAVVPLWLLHYRKNYEALSDGTREFMRLVVDGRISLENITDGQRQSVLACANGWPARMSGSEDLPELLVPLWREYRDGRHDLSSALKGTKPMENRWLLATYIFLWPFQIIDMVFGDLLYRFARWVVTLVARLLIRLSRIMKYGMPSNLD